MRIRDILVDALNYFRLDKKSWIILGLFLVISDTLIAYNHMGLYNIFFDIQSLIGILIGLLAYGYVYKIIKFSLEKKNEIPAFNDWKTLFFYSVKMFIVGFVYYIPITIFLMISNVLYASTITHIFVVSFSPLQFIGVIFQSIIVQHTLTIFYILSSLARVNYLGLLVILYCIIITPIMFIAMAYMIDNNGKINKAFHIREVFTKIGIIGWKKLIKWYIVSGFVYLLLVQIMVMSGIYPILYLFILPLTLVPFLYIYIARSIALIYNSND